MPDASSQQQLDELTRRIATTETVQALHRLVSRSSQGVDNRDTEAFLSTFWDDSVWNIGAPFEPFVGIDAIARAGQEVLFAVWSLTHHLMGNIVVTIEGADSASSTCDVTAFVVRKDDGLAHTIGATYNDRLERRGDEWRVARRDVVTRFMAPHPGQETVAPGPRELERRRTR